MGGRVFEGEKNYNAPAIGVFGDKKWNVMLQTVNGFISKIAINVVLSTEREANQVALRLLGYCIKELGKPNEQRTGFFIWDTTDGNIILQTGETADGLAVALFLTSKFIRNFKKHIDDASMPEREKSSDDASIEVTEPTYADLYDQKPSPAADDAQKTQFSNNKRKVEEQRMTLSTKRTFAGSYTVLRTKGFTCGVSSLKGWFGQGTIAIMRADANGEIVKYPIVAEAWFPGPTKERRDWMHDYIANALDELGNKTRENIFSGSEEPFGLYYALEGTFSVAKGQGRISKYIIDDRLRIGKQWGPR